MTTPKTTVRGVAPSNDHDHQHFPGWVWGVYVLLFSASVPWYVRADAPLRLWFGLPHWVVLSLLATTGVAVFTGYVVRRFWRDEEPPDA